MRTVVLALAVALASLVAAVCGSGLPQFNVDSSRVSVSGISSGAFMAVQLHVAFSKLFKGVGAVAGGPYYCAQDQFTTALTQCMTLPMGVNVQPLVAKAKEFASSGKIDDTSNLANSRVYAFSGTADTVVNPAVVKSLVSFYEAFVSKDNIYTEFDIDAQHSMPTLDFGNSCTTLASPYINKCDYDAAGKILAQIHGSLNASVAQNSSGVIEFDQSAYASDPESVGLAKSGYAYIPAACWAGAVCGVHVALHGCNQNYEHVGSDYVVHSGYNEWAESNNFIVLYPQATKLGFSNPNGCWDWWGVTNSDYAVQDGPQMKAVAAMVRSLMG